MISPDYFWKKKMEYKKNIIYAEDDGTIRAIAYEFIKNEIPFANFELFNNGISLEKRLQQGSKGIDLVLTDNNMPGKTGREVIKKYAKLSEFEKIPFMLFYGGLPSIGEQALRDGAFAYILKPVDFKVLVNTIKKALNFY